MWRTFLWIMLWKALEVKPSGCEGSMWGNYHYKRLAWLVEQLVASNHEFSFPFLLCFKKNYFSNHFSIFYFVTPCSPNTYLVAYSDFLIIFFIYFLYSFCIVNYLYDRFALDPDLWTQSLLFLASANSCVCDSCVCSPASHFQNPRPSEYIPLLSFPLFLSPR